MFIFYWVDRDNLCFTWSTTGCIQSCVVGTELDDFFVLCFLCCFLTPLLAGNEFPGIFAWSGPPSRCWSSDGTKVYFVTQWRSEEVCDHCEVEIFNLWRNKPVSCTDYFEVHIVPCCVFVNIILFGLWKVHRSCTKSFLKYSQETCSRLLHDAGPKNMQPEKKT